MMAYLNKLSPLQWSLMVLTISILLCFHFGLTAMQDINWDQRNYHRYSVYAMFNERLNFDIAPAQIQNWFNPFGSIIQYFLIEYLSPKLATVTLALLSAPNAWLVWLISRRILTPLAPLNPGIVLVGSTMAAIAAFTAPIFTSVIATTFNDGFVAMLVLMSVSIFIHFRHRFRWLVLCGICFGIAFSMKYTVTFYIVGFAVAVIFTYPLQLIRLAPPMVLGFFIAAIPLSGIWMWHLYEFYGSPLFPWYNEIFQSPYYEFRNIHDLRFLPKEGLLTFVWDIAVGNKPSTELHFRDVRFIALLILILTIIPGLIFQAFFRRSTEIKYSEVEVYREIIFVIIFFASSFYLWAHMFGIQRYAVALDQIAGTLIAAAITYICVRLLRTPTIAIAGFGLTIVCLLWLGLPPDWGRRAHQDTWFGITLPSELAQNNTLYVMLSGAPMSYVIPDFPSTSRFVRYGGNLALSDEAQLTKQILEVIKTHTGPIRTLSLETWQLEASKGGLEAYGLAVDNDACVSFKSNIDGFNSCALIKLKK